MDIPLPASTLVHLTVRTPVGTIAAVAEMLPVVAGRRQPYRFLALDEQDSDKLQRFLSSAA